LNAHRLENKNGCAGRLAAFSGLEPKTPPKSKNGVGYSMNESYVFIASLASRYVSILGIFIQFGLYKRG
jgi:hypothetical protein